MYEGAETVSEISELIKSNVRVILKNAVEPYAVEPYIDVDVVEVANSEQDYGTLRYMILDGPEYGVPMG